MRARSRTFSELIFYFRLGSMAKASDARLDRNRTAHLDRKEDDLLAIAYQELSIET